jgi:hypothetical protein
MLSVVTQFSNCIVLKTGAAWSLLVPEFFPYRFTAPQQSLVAFIQAVSSVATVRLT